MPIRPSALAAAVLASLAVFALPVASGQSVRGESLKLENAKRDIAHAFRASALAPQATLRFQALDTARVSAMQRHNVANGAKRLQIGIERDAADEASNLLPAGLTWLPVEGGRVLHFDVTSPQAAALRVGLELRGLPDGAELRVASRSGGLVEFVDAEAMIAGVDGNGVYWSPVTEGDTQRIELYVPAGTAGFAPDVRRVSHLVTSPLRPIEIAKVLKASGSCNIDVACRTGTLGQPFVNAKNAVARMVFQDGGTYFCTGTLLNDSTPATQEAYFYSAAHCLRTQAVANTVSTFWNYETPTCGVSNSGSNIQTAGGADLLFQSVRSDVLFLRLRATPPSGAFFAGWNATTLSPSTSIIAIHHPGGDIKKVSRGIHGGMLQNYDLDGQILDNVARATWIEGTTEGGSSGSGMFTLNGSDYQLRGGLAGGYASCANSGQPETPTGNQDVYSRFDLAYPALQQWLSAANGPTRDYTGAWYVPAEPGWGLTVFNYPGQVFALFFVYDTQGRPAWYRLQSAWTGADQVTARLDRPNGPAWSSNFNPNAVGYTAVGNATLTFTSATSATMTFNDGTVNRTVTLAKL